MNISRIQLIIIGLILLVISVYFILLTHLDKGEQAIQSDVIIVPEGTVDGDRPLKAAELLNEGFSRSNKMIVSPLDENNINYYEQVDIDLNNQVINDSKSTSTYENAVNTFDIMQKLGYESAIVISSDYHILRTKMIYERVNSDYGFDVTYVSAYHPVNGEMLPWYQGSRNVKLAGLVEPIKYIGYLVGLYHMINL